MSHVFQDRMWRGLITCCNRLQLNGWGVTQIQWPPRHCSLIAEKPLLSFFHGLKGIQVLSHPHNGPIHPAHCGHDPISAQRHQREQFEILLVPSALENADHDGPTDPEDSKHFIGLRRNSPQHRRVARNAEQQLRLQVLVFQRLLRTESNHLQYASNRVGHHRIRPGGPCLSDVAVSSQSGIGKPSYNKGASAKKDRHRNQHHRRIREQAGTNDTHDKNLCNQPKCSDHVCIGKDLRPIIDFSQNTP